MIKVFISNQVIKRGMTKSLFSALEVIKGMREDITRIYDCHEANYFIVGLEEINDFDQFRTPVVKGVTKHLFYPIVESFSELKSVIKSMAPTDGFQWKWKYNDLLGYEVTSRGDKRFSPLFQYINFEGKLISMEDHYRKHIKPAKENGTYVEGTGHKLMESYLMDKLGLIYELAYIGQSHPFTDMFDKYGGQNKWYSEILNNIVRDGK